MDLQLKLDKSRDEIAVLRFKLACTNTKHSLTPLLVRMGYRRAFNKWKYIFEELALESELQREKHRRISGETVEEEKQRVATHKAKLLADREEEERHKSQCYKWNNACEIINSIEKRIKQKTQTTRIQKRFHSWVIKTLHSKYKEVYVRAVEPLKSYVHYQEQLLVRIEGDIRAELLERTKPFRPTTIWTGIGMGGGGRSGSISTLRVASLDEVDKVDRHFNRHSNFNGYHHQHQHHVHPKYAHAQYEGQGRQRDRDRERDRDRDRNRNRKDQEQEQGKAVSIPVSKSKAMSSASLHRYSTNSKQQNQLPHSHSRPHAHTHKLSNLSKHEKSEFQELISFRRDKHDKHWQKNQSHSRLLSVEGRNGRNPSSSSAVTRMRLREEHGLERAEIAKRVYNYECAHGGRRGYYIDNGNDGNDGRGHNVSFCMSENKDEDENRCDGHSDSADSDCTHSTHSSYSYNVSSYSGSRSRGGEVESKFQYQEGQDKDQSSSTFDMDPSLIQSPPQFQLSQGFQGYNPHEISARKRADGMNLNIDSDAYSDDDDADDDDDDDDDDDADTVGVQSVDSDLYNAFSERHNVYNMNM